MRLFFLCERNLNYFQLHSQFTYCPDILGISLFDGLKEVNP